MSLESSGVPLAPLRGDLLGASRQGRDITGYRIGSGPRSISLIAGCHADEPVGPAMLDRLTAWLLELPASAPLVSRFTWFLVPHVNPDGEARNASWTDSAFGEGTDPIAADAGIDLGHYLARAVREPPGDDVEFGFPRGVRPRSRTTPRPVGLGREAEPEASGSRGGGDDDDGARPENRAVAAFLRRGAPFSLHASFHGMCFAAGPWFLIEAAWIERTAAMRQRLRRRVRELGYRLHDVDRGGEKGFHRIDEGFTTRPDSRPMAAHFEALGDPATAALFRPSSMEHVRSLGGDPLTLVSEMPLFLVPDKHYGSVGAPPARRSGNVVTPAVVRELSAAPWDRMRSLAAERGIEPMPIVDQMRLQLEFLQAGLEACCA